MAEEEPKVTEQKTREQIQEEKRLKHVTRMRQNTRDSWKKRIELQREIKAAKKGIPVEELPEPKELELAPILTKDTLVDPVWEKQMGESPLQFLRFMTYCRLPSNIRDRSEQSARIIFEKEAKQLGIPFNPDKEYRQILTAPKQMFLWEIRAAAYDKSLEDELRQKWMERELERREENWDVGRQILEIVKEALPIMTASNMDMVATPKGINQLLTVAAGLMKESIPNPSLNGPDEIAQLLQALPLERAQRLRMMLLVQKD